MARYADMLHEIRPSVTEAPAPEMEEAVRRAVIEFLRLSNAWSGEQQITLEAGKAEYRLSVNRGRVDKIWRAVLRNDRGIEMQLRHSKYGELAVANKQPRLTEPTHYAHDQDKILIWQTPTDVSANPVVDLFCSFVPTRRSDSFPDHVFEEWFEGLRHGALYYLHSVPDKVWTDGSLAQYHYREFHREITNARQQSYTGGWAPGRVTLRKWR